MAIVLTKIPDPNTEVATLKNINTDINNLLVSAIKVDGQWVPLSRFNDDTWRIIGAPNNVTQSDQLIHFKSIPENFRDALKEIAYTFLMRGRDRRKKPKGGTVIHFIKSLMPFLKYLKRIGVTDLRRIPKIAFANFVHECRKTISIRGKPLSKVTISKRLIAIEAMYELSQHTQYALPEHPWPDDSAVNLSKMTGTNAQHNTESSTPLMPDTIFCALFENAYQHIQKADYLLDIRDKLIETEQRLRGPKSWTFAAEREKIFSLHNYQHGLAAYKLDLIDIRTSCYIILASTSGCRNHELANLQNGAHHKTNDDDGEIYHWMRTRSEKTYAGICDWMIPAIAVRALRIMERWAAPYQSRIAEEISRRRRINPRDPEITEAQKHAHSIFLSSKESHKKDRGYRTLSLCNWNTLLQNYLIERNLDWHISSHQFRKKFANYSAHSKFGDLRYLKEHFKHWTMDMTLLYAMDETWGQHFDLDLLSEIESEESVIKKETAIRWFTADKLSGGYGHSLKGWQRDPANLAIFSDHATMIESIAQSTAIRSNGHSWCTADDSGCVGNTIERSRCGGCTNAVIGKEHIPIYRALYSNLQGLLECKDIGEPGTIRVRRDLQRYASVLGDLGINVETDLG